MNRKTFCEEHLELEQISVNNRQKYINNSKNYNNILAITTESSRSISHVLKFLRFYVTTNHEQPCAPCLVTAELVIHYNVTTCLVNTEARCVERKATVRKQ